MSEAELRSMVREILKEALGQRRPAAAPAAAAPGGSAPEPVRIGSDDDLAAFVRRLAALMQDPAAAAAIRAGRHRFTLAGPAAGARPLPSAPAAPAVAVLDGTVTEAKVSRLGKVAAVRLAPGAVLTPLARDRLRALGIAIEGRR